MSFEWQTRERAAATLEVDAATLQAWIDQGRAPSRNNQGRVEVLIEFPDDEGEPKPDAEAEFHEVEASGSAASERVIASEPQVVNALEVVSRRELQLAGGIAAAWQRLAEQADHELVRSRRMSMVAWSIVAAAVVLGGAGMWWATVMTKDAQTEAHLASQRVTELASDVAERQEALSQSTQRVEALSDELARAKADLAAATERSTTLAAATDAARRQHDQLLAALKETIDQQRQRVTELQATLADQRKQSGDTRTQLKQTERSLAEAVARSSELQKQLDQLESPSDPSPAPTPDPDPEASAEAP